MVRCANEPAFVSDNAQKRNMKEELLEEKINSHDINNLLVSSLLPPSQYFAS